MIEKVTAILKAYQATTENLGEDESPAVFATSTVKKVIEAMGVEVASWEESAYTIGGCTNMEVLLTIPDILGEV